MDQTLQGPTGGAPVDWRGLCEELADALACHYPGHVDDGELVNRVRAELAKPERFLAPQVTEPTVLRPIDRYELGELVRVSWLKHGNDAWCSIADDVIAALAQPEPEGVGPTDQELADAFAEGCRDGSKAGEPPFLGGARAVLARWGRPAPVPAGEVGELVAWLRANALTVQKANGNPANGAKQRMNRVADLLSQRHPVPVPVAALSSDYREPWDMSSEDGSQCFASAILSRLVGVDAADEADARWLAAYLQANSRPQHFQPASVPVSELLPELTEAFKDLPPGRIELLPEDARVIEPAEHTILVPAPTPVPVAIPGEKYHEDMGAVTWWRLPFDEPPWVGTPNDSDWPGYHTHFTPAPPEPATALPLPQGEVK